MNIVEMMLQERLLDTETSSGRIIEQYAKTNKAGRAEIDELLTRFCGWPLPLLMKMCGTSPKFPKVPDESLQQEILRKTLEQVNGEYGTGTITGVLLQEGYKGVVMRKDATSTEVKDFLYCPETQVLTFLGHEQPLFEYRKLTAPELETLKLISEGCVICQKILARITEREHLICAPPLMEHLESLLEKEGQPK